MINNTSKRYVNALILSYKKEELSSVLQTLESVASAFRIPKFRDIVKSPTLKEESKVELIASFIKNPSEKIVNFIKLLAKNRRIALPQIVEELRKNIAALDNKYLGKIYSATEIDAAKIKELEAKISKKFNADITLQPVKSELEGIKIEVEDLGFEISFSVDRLKQKMSEYILKAI